MISLKSPREIESMRHAGSIAAAAREIAGKMALPGVSTREIDEAITEYIRGRGAEPSFYRYNGYPAGVCISVNNQVIHGIPGKRRLREGDVVSIDVGACFEGFHGDCAATFACGEITPEARRLIEVTEQSFFEGIARAKPGYRVSDISHGVQKYAESQGFSLVREYTGHGVGARLHEDPEVPNYGEPGHGPRLVPGMTLAVEPMVNAGTHRIRVLDDGWTVETADGSLSAHYENTILITGGEPEILTALRP